MLEIIHTYGKNAILILYGAMQFHWQNYAKRHFTRSRDQYNKIKQILSARVGLSPYINDLSRTLKTIYLDEVSTNAVKSLLGMMAQPTTPSRPDQQSSGVPRNAHQQGYVHTSRQRSTASTSSDRILLGQVNVLKRSTNLSNLIIVVVKLGFTVSSL